jgi:hypothetical protein
MSKEFCSKPLLLEYIENTKREGVPNYEKEKFGDFEELGDSEEME